MQDRIRPNYRLAIVIITMIVSLGMVYAQDALTIDENGTVAVTTELDITGELDVTGNVTVGGDVSVGGVVSAANVFLEIKEVFLTMPTRAQDFGYENLPAGFTYENTYILSAAVQSNYNNTWYPVMLSGGEYYMRITIQDNDKIALTNQWGNDTFDQQNPVKVLLVRVN